MTVKHQVKAALVSLACVLLLIASSCGAADKFEIQANNFEYAEVTVRNPMKGFVSFYPEVSEYTSIEYIGMKFSDVCYYNDNNELTLNTSYIEEYLYGASERYKTVIIRIYTLYPGYNDGDDTGLYLPDKLYNSLKASGDIYSNQYEGHSLEYPNFNSSALMSCLEDFIALFGEEYDGHPVIAAIELGLYGSWGEWNMTGCENESCAMSEQNMSRLISAYTSAFTTTKLLARNPSLGEAHSYDIGFHDDNFLFNTSDFHTVSSEWKSLLQSIDYSYANLQQFYDFISGSNGAYEPLWDRWETQMFGGELSGYMYMDDFGSIFDGIEREALDYCIQQFHISWVIGTGNGSSPDDEDFEFYDEYAEVVQSMGYEIGIIGVSQSSDGDSICVEFYNYGIAPFYYDWEVEYSVWDSDGNVIYTYVDEDFELSKLLPESTAQSELPLAGNLSTGEYTVTVRFVNPVEDISECVMALTLANNNALGDGVYEIATVTAK